MAGQDCGKTTEPMGDRFARLANELHSLTPIEHERLGRAMQNEKERRSAQNGAAACMEGATAGPLEPANYGLEGYSSQELSLTNIDDAMAYQSWGPGEREYGERVREVLVLAAKTILRNVPRSPRRTLALQHLISARMDANAAISFRGRF